MMQLVEYKAKPISVSVSSLSSKAKLVIPHNTRFHYQNESRLISSSRNALTTSDEVSSHHRIERGAMTTRGYETDSTMGTDLDASPLPLSMERAARAEKIQKSRNTFVAMTPLIVPGQGGSTGGRAVLDDGESRLCYDEEEEEDEDGSPIVTWGNVASTPLVVKDNQGRACDPAEFDYRDKEGHGNRSISSRTSSNSERSIVAVQSQNRTKSKKQKLTSRFDRTESLTPAAQRLLDKCNGHKRNSTLQLGAKSKGLPSSSEKINARSSSAFGSTLRMSYSRKPSSLSYRGSSGSTTSRRTSQLKRKDHLHKATPLLSPKRLRQDRTQVGSAKGEVLVDKKSLNITGDLLKLS